MSKLFLVFDRFFRQKYVTFFYLSEVLQYHNSGNYRRNLGKIVLAPQNSFGRTAMSRLFRLINT